MPSNTDEPRVALSLWDKLSEEAPEQEGSRPLVWTATVQELRKSVARDLEFLLNARHGEFDTDVAFEETGSSVLAYGLIDFTTLALSATAERERLRRSVERSIRQFEPRLAHVKVTVGEWDPAHTGLTLHLSAELRVEPENEPVAFNAVLAKDSRRFAISGGRL